MHFKKLFYEPRNEKYIGMRIALRGRQTVNQFITEDILKPL